MAFARETGTKPTPNWDYWDEWGGGKGNRDYLLFSKFWDCQTPKIAKECELKRAFQISGEDFGNPEA